MVAMLEKHIKSETFDTLLIYFCHLLIAAKRSEKRQSVRDVSSLTVSDYSGVYRCLVYP